MNFPSGFITSIEGLPGYTAAAFEQVHASAAAPVSVRINPAKKTNVAGGYSVSSLEQVPWTTNGYYLPERPSFTFDPLFHAGTYYVQEASSMFLEQAMKQLAPVEDGIRVLDLCAAPGGKSTHLVSLLDSQSLLVSNEVIRARSSILRDNIVKWGFANTVVTNNDPKDFQQLPGFFDVLVIDAPCSGSGLFRREPEAMEEWSAQNVQLCSQRQQRILADSWPALKTGGILIYSTCSYSAEEDEEIMDWIVKDLGAEHCSLQLQENWNIIETLTDDGNKGYRFWPDKVKGEGFFMACFRKTADAEESPLKAGKKLTLLTRQEIAVASDWIISTGFRLFKNAQTVYAWPEQHIDSMVVLLERTRLISSGIKTGELVRDKLIPDHALAMSTVIGGNVPRINLDNDTAIRYLQRKDIGSVSGSKGWALACYDNHPLGWMNMLPGRINNYYPKELRILKEN